MDEKTSWWRAYRNRLLVLIGCGLIASGVVIGSLVGGWWSSTSSSDDACDATVYEGCPGRWDYLIDNQDG